MPEKDEKIPSPRLYRLMEDYPGIDLEKTKERFERLSGFFADLLDDYVTKVLGKYGCSNDYLSKEDHMKEILLHDPYVRDLLIRSLVYPPFDFEGEGIEMPAEKTKQSEVDFELPN